MIVRWSFERFLISYLSLLHSGNRLSTLFWLQAEGVHRRAREDRSSHPRPGQEVKPMVKNLWNFFFAADGVAVFRRLGGRTLNPKVGGFESRHCHSKREHGIKVSESSPMGAATFSIRTPSITTFSIIMMLSCHLWVLLMLNVTYAGCCLCWVSLMLSVAYSLDSN
jgi:hypothetical protein